MARFEQQQNRSRLANEVYQTLLGRFIAREITPNSRITVDGLARDLGVSQTPIREALTRLEADGLVVKTHLVGYSAAPPMTEDEFEDLFEIRRVLEPYSAGAAANRRTQEQLEGMRSLAQSMSANLHGAATYGEFAQRDSELHELIVAASGNELLRDSFVRLHAHLHLFRLLYDTTITEDAIDEHDHIISAIAESDAERATAEMTRHLERSRQRLHAAYR